MLYSDPNSKTSTKLREAAFFQKPILETRPAAPALSNNQSHRIPHPHPLNNQEAQGNHNPLGSRILLLLSTLLISSLLTIAAIYFVLIKSPSTTQEIKQQAENLKVSFLNSDWEKQVPGELSTDPYNTVFDPKQHSSNINIDIVDRQFAFINKMRQPVKSNFQLSQQQGTNQQRTQASSLGIRPSPDKQGRYQSQSSLDWQGNFEINNPQANIQRGSSYLKYLRNKLNNKFNDSLSVRKLNSDANKLPLPQHSKPEIPLLSYQN